MSKKREPKYFKAEAAAFPKSVKEAYDALRRGEYSEARAALLERALRERSDEVDLYGAISVYVKYCPDWKPQIIESFIETYQDGFVVGNAISELGFASTIGDHLWPRILVIAMGEPWDVNDDAQLMALSALGSAPGKFEADVKLALGLAVIGHNEVCAQVAIESAQRFLGIPLEECLRTGKGLLEKVQPNVRQWLTGE